MTTGADNNGMNVIAADRGGFALRASTLLDSLSIGIVLPVIPFAMESLGASPRFITLHLVFFAAGMLIFSPILGRVGDRVGLKLTILGAVIVTLFGVFGLWASTSWALFLVFRFIQGIGGAKEALIQAIGVIGQEQGRRTEILASLGAWRLIGVFLGPVLGGVIATSYGDSFEGFRMAILASLVAAAMSFVFAIQLQQPSAEPVRKSATTNTQTSDARNRLKKAVIWTTLGYNFFVGICMGIVLSLTALYLNKAYGFSTLTIGFVFAVLAVLVAISRAKLSVNILTKYSARDCVAGLGFGLGIMMLLMGLSSGAAAFIPSLFVGGVVVGAIPIAISAAIEQATEDSEKGRYFGLVMAAFAAGQICSATVGGYIFETVSFGAPYFWAGIVLLGWTILIELKRWTASKKALDLVQ